MSLSTYIKWCICNRRILTTAQIKEGKRCGICQEEHAKGFKDRFAKLGAEEEGAINGKNN